MGTTINLSLAAVGLDGVLRDGGATGLTISSSADGFFLQTGSEKADGLAAAEGDLSRLRLALAASRPFPLDHHSSWLTPALELGLRQDSGDAETGFGLDLAASVGWVAAERGMAVMVKGRRLLSHGAEGEWQDQGRSASLSWDPTPSSPLGHSLSVCRSWGGSTATGLDALLSPDAFPSLGGVATSAEGGRQALEAALAYGFPVHRDALVLTPEVGWRLSPQRREYRLRWSLQPLPQEQRGNWNVSLDAWRRTPVRNASAAAADPEHALTLRFATLLGR